MSVFVDAMVRFLQEFMFFLSCCIVRVEVLEAISRIFISHKVKLGLCLISFDVMV